MTDDTEFRPSRRAMLCASVSVVISGLIAARADAQQQPKMAQKLVQYQQTPKGPQECDNCLHFEPPASCKVVDGKINPKGWCQLYAPKPKTK